MEVNYQLAIKAYVHFILMPLVAQLIQGEFLWNISKIENLSFYDLN